MLAAHGDEAGFVEQVVGGVQDQLAVGEFGVGEAVEAQAVGVAGFGVDFGADEVAVGQHQDFAGLGVGRLLGLELQGAGPGAVGKQRGKLAFEQVAHRLETLLVELGVGLQAGIVEVDGHRRGQHAGVAGGAQQRGFADAGGLHRV